jgi:hypothetical protein
VVPSVSDDYLRRIFEIDDIAEFKRVSLRAWKDLHPARTRKKRGPQPPDVYWETVDVLRPLWERVIPYTDLLRVNVKSLEKLQPGMTVKLNAIPVKLPSGETVHLLPNEPYIEITAAVLRAVKQWKNLRLKEDVVRRVRDAVGDNPARARRLQEWKDKLAKAKTRMKQNPNNPAYGRQVAEAEEGIVKIEQTSLYRHEDRLAPYVRDAAIRYLLTMGLSWHEMPPCLVDKRQPWLGKINRVNRFYDRQETFMNHWSDTKKEF